MDYRQVIEEIEYKKDAITSVVSSWTTYDKFIAHAELYLDKNSYKLDKISKEIIIADCIIDAAKIGIYVDGRNAHLISSDIKDKATGRVKFTSCQLRIDYKGMRTIAKRHLPIIDIYAEVVREEDEFDYQLGDYPAIKHVPSLSRNQSKRIYCYAIAKLSNGHIIREVMTEQEIAIVRSKAQTQKIWNEFTSQMWKKSVLRRLCDKLLDDVDSTAMSAMLDVENKEYDFEPKEKENPLLKYESNSSYGSISPMADAAEKEAIKQAELQHNRSKMEDSGIDHEKVDEWIASDPEDTDVIPGEDESAEDLQPEKPKKAKKSKVVLPFDKPMMKRKIKKEVLLQIFDELSENDRNHAKYDLFVKAIKNYADTNKTTYSESYAAILKAFDIQEFSDWNTAAINRNL